MNSKKTILSRTVHTIFFDDHDQQENFDPNKIKVDEKSYNDNLIYHIGCVTVKHLSYAETKCKSVITYYQ